MHVYIYIIIISPLDLAWDIKLKYFTLLTLGNFEVELIVKFLRISVQLLNTSRNLHFHLVSE